MRWNYNDILANSLNDLVITVLITEYTEVVLTQCIDPKLYEYLTRCSMK